MFEWLIHAYDNTLLESSSIEEHREEKIVIALKIIGITNYNHKRGGTQNDLLQSVQGLNGLSDSVDLIFRLTQFVINSRLIDEKTII